MLITARALVLHTFRYSDEALIAHCLAEGRGSVSFVVRVSRSKRAAVRHVLFSPFATLTLTWNDRATAELQRVQQATVAEPLTSIPFEPSKQAIVLFLSEFLHHAVRLESDPSTLFAYITASIRWLDAAPSGYANFHLVFLVRLARFLGFSPNVELPAEGAAWFDLRAGCFVGVRPMHGDVAEPAEAQFLPTLMRINFGTMRLFRFTSEQRAALLRHIIAYYRLHLPGFPELRSLDVLHDLFHR